MNKALYQPPYSEAAATSISVRNLQTEGLTRSFVVLEGDPWAGVDVREFPGHSEIDLGPTLGRVRHPMGEDRMVWMGGLLGWDPTIYQVKAELLEEDQLVSDYTELKEAYEAEGWGVELTTPDRVVGIRPLEH